jgi:opacity protein-like surface antigen
MKIFTKYSLLGLALSAALFAAPAAKADVITFDDLTGSGDLTSYMGITWSNASYYDGLQDPYTAKSGAERIYNSDHLSPLTLLFGGDVEFNGAWFSGYDFSNPFFELYNDGSLVGTSGSLVLSNSPQFLASGYAGPVDEVRVLAADNNGLRNFYVMDDVTFNGGAQDVPEPGTLALLAGFGVTGLMVIRRRK